MSRIEISTPAPAKLGQMAAMKSPAVVQRGSFEVVEVA